MVGSHDYRLVLLSIVIAFTFAFAAFSLFNRVFHSVPRTARWWTLGSAFAMGSGIWSMHFVAMLGFSLPMPVGYALDSTLLSWVMAVSVSWLGLRVATRHNPSAPMLIAGGIILGGGICVMHYIDMYAMRITPQIAYDPMLLSLSLIIAVGGAMAALLILVWLRVPSLQHPLRRKILAAAVMAGTIAGTHYTGMAAARFPANATSGVVTNSDPVLLAIIITLSALGVLLISFIIKLLYGTDSLELAHGKTGDEHDLNQMAMLDSLTRLPNRRFFQQHLEVGIRRTARIGSSLAVAFIDLDGFKPVNDALGHHIGDEVLRLAAKRLNAAVRGCDLVARIGGDEFVAMIEDIKSDQDIVPIIERIVHSLREPFFIEEHEILISGSVGIAVYPRDGDMERLMVCADAAMYRAKSDGKNQFRFYDADIELASDRLQEMQHDIRNALIHGQFELHFQPKIGSHTRKLAGVEALLRWEHPIKGVLSPEIFIPAAERFGMINQIGDWIIEETCRTLYHLREQGIELTASINLSSQQIRNANLVSYVQKTLQDFGLPPSCLMFELTEASAMQYPKQFDSLLNEFNSIGVDMALDDFGTGYSSLSYLQNSQVSEVKLDSTFLSKITHDLQTRAIVDAVIRMAHALGLTVVAEGVETEEQRKVLTELGVNQLQGFLFARPVPEEKLANLVRQLAMLEKKVIDMDKPAPSPT